MSRDMSVRQSWNITADSVIFGGRNSGALCSVTVSVNSKNLMITTDEQEVSYRLSKVGIADKGASAILHGDGMKISISIQSASNKKAIEELRLALECKTSDAAFTKGKSATSASSSSKTPHPSSTMIGKVKHAIKSVSRHSDGIRQSLSSVSATTIRSTPSNVLRDSFSEGGSASTHASSISQNASSAKTMETAVSTPLMAGNVNLGQEEQATSAKNPILTAAWPVHHQITPLRDSLQTPIDPYSSAYKRLQPLSLAHCLSTSRASRVQISEAVVSSPLQTIAAPAVFKSDHLKSWFHSRIDSIGPFAESISRFQGIANIGNSCYMNAILQGLFGTTRIHEAILKAVNDGLRASRPVTTALAELAGQYSKLNHGVLSTLQLKMAIDVYCGDRFLLNEQHDAHEFLSALLDLLSDELSKKDTVCHEVLHEASSNVAPCSLSLLQSPAINTPSVTIANHTNNTITVKKRLFFDDIRGESDFKRLKGEHNTDSGPSVTARVETLRAKSELCGLYTSVVQNCITCNTCGKSRIKEEEYRDFSLEMGTLQQELGQKKSLEDLIAHFFSADTRELACEHCNDTDAVATVTQSISTLPDVLIVHLKRFVFDRKSFDFHKCSTEVTFPSELNMSRYLADSVPLDAINSYQLSCVVRHHGEGVRSGHYLCDISDGDGWKRCDDSIIAAALKATVLEDTTTPYIFFYQRKASGFGSIICNDIE